MRRSLTIFAALCGLAPATVLVEVTPAKADLLCDIICSQDFRKVPANCDISAVKVSGSFQRRSYDYERICGDVREAKVSAAFDVSTGRAQEQITALNGEWVIRTLWTCSDDPWISPSNQVSCGNSKIKMTGGSYQEFASQITSPLSASTLSASSRHVLEAQLQNAINVSVTPKSQPAGPLTAPDSITNRRHGSPAQTALTGKVNADVDLYNVPDGTNGKVIGLLQRGQTVSLVVSCHKGDWCQIAQPAGWAWGDFIN